MTGRPARPSSASSGSSRASTSASTRTPSPRPGLYLFLGPDRTRKRERVDVLATQAAVDVLDRHDLYADDLTIASLNQLARALPAASAARLIVVDEADRLDRGVAEHLLEQIELLASSTFLVLLVHAEPGAKSALKALQPKAAVERFDWLMPAQLSQWIEGYAKEQGRAVAPAAIQELLARFGADLSALRGGLDQVLASTEPTDTVSAEQVRQVLPRRDASRPVAGQDAGNRGGFALVDAIVRRDAADALRCLREQLDAGKDAVEVFGLLAWQLQRWMTVARLSKAGVSRDQIATVAGMAAWQVERVQRELSGRPLSQLQLAVERCWQMDLGAKTGRGIPELGLEQLVITLCLPPAHARAA